MVSPCLFYLALKVRRLWSQMFIGLASAVAPPYWYPQTEQRTHRYQISHKKKTTTTTQAPLSLGNQSKAVPPGQRWNRCFTCDAHWYSARQGGDEAEALLVTLRLLKNKNPPAQLQLQADVLQGAEVTGSSVREAPRWWMALRATRAQSAVALTAEKGPSQAEK